MAHRRGQIIGMLVMFLLAALCVLSPAQAEKITYFHFDALGSPLAASDEAGNLLWREDYRPYGERIRNEDDASNIKWYTGKPHDEDTGLTYFGARYYNPVVGRFMGVDPQFFKEENSHSFNRYAYANNNPYAYVDPDGQAAVLAFPLILLAEIAFDTISAPDVPFNSGVAQQSITFTPGPLKGIGAAGKGLGITVTKGPLWSSTKSKTAAENAFGHFKKHKSEFPELQNAKQYAEGAKKFFNNPPKGTLTKTNSRGDTLRYNPNTNTFGVLSKDGAPRTMFRPKDGIDYWNRQ